jgi:hypothetical protein
MCKVVKPRENFFIVKRENREFLSAYCRSCSQAYYAAKRAEERANRPPKPPKPVKYCESGVCDREAKSRVRGEGPWLCMGHWQQARAGKQFTPLRGFNQVATGLRRCSACERVKPDEAFYLKADKVTRQATCKDCDGLSNSFHQYKRNGMLKEALGVTESMPERMRKRLMDKYATLFNQSELERSNERRETA